MGRRERSPAARELVWSELTEQRTQDRCERSQPILMIDQEDEWRKKVPKSTGGLP
jgi:hypothetical protein